MTSDPHALLFMTVAALAGWLMTQAGLVKNVLHHRRRRRCPTCGRLDRCGCGR